MEFDIDTSQFFHLKNNDNNKGALIKLDNLFSDSIKSFRFEDFENITIKIRQILFKKGKSLISLIGEIIENNQTIYSLYKKEYIYIYLQDKDKIQKIKEKLFKNDLYITLSINKILFYPIKLRIYDPYLIIFIQTMIELYLSFFQKNKINQNSTILIKGETKDEEKLYNIFLSFLGYNSVYLFEEIKNDFSNFQFDNILDFTNTMLEGEQKILTFNLLNQNGIYNSITYDIIQNDNIQMIPNDFYILFQKNISLNFTNLNSKIENFVNHGKLNNIISDFLEKINISFLKEKLKDIQIGNYTEINENQNYNENYLSLFNLI